MNCFSSNGIPIAYIDEGDGPPVILAHCSSASHRVWRPLIDELKSQYRVIAPDLIGYGASGSWPAERRYDALADAELLIELARMAGEPAHFVGHSFGGAMALEAVRQLGGHARGMTLIEPVSFPLLPLAGRMAEWDTVGRVADRVIEAMSKDNRVGAADAYMGFWLGRLRWWMAPRKFKNNVLKTVDKVALEFRAAKEGTARRLEDYRALRLPTLLLCGAKTRKPAKAVIEVLQETLPMARTDIIAGAGHMSPITHAGRVNALIRAHVEACKEARSGAYPVEAAGSEPSSLTRF